MHQVYNIKHGKPKYSIIRVNPRCSNGSLLAIDTDAEMRLSERTADGVDKMSAYQPRQLGIEDRRFVGLSLLSGKYSRVN